MFSVIFDMDGTLLDTQRIFIPAWEYAGEKLGYKNAGRYLPEACGTNDQGSTHVLLSHFPDMDVPKFKAIVREYIEQNMVVRYKDGSKEVLDYLKSCDIKTGLATGTSRRSVEHHLKIVGAKSYFDAIVCGNEVEQSKPAPDIFLETARQMGVKPQDCFVFEDSENGIMAGYRAGMKCIGVADVKPFSPKFKALMYCELDNIKEAIKIFEKL